MRKIFLFSYIIIIALMFAILLRSAYRDDFVTFAAAIGLVVGLSSMMAILPQMTLVFSKIDQIDAELAAYQEATLRAYRVTEATKRIAAQNAGISSDAINNKVKELDEKNWKPSK